ncbi:MAG: TlpA disulfide reductase family protein [Ruminococcus sp.]|nr:TlpA disulfide reductase family protein [Ruminococcus sp.]
MEKNIKKWTAIVMSGILCAMAFSGCAAEEQSVSSEKTNDSLQISSQSDGTSEKNSEDTSQNTVGEFSTQDVYGNAYTKDIFKDYDLTLVNVYTTWCTPCVQEMPDLDKLYQQVKDEGVNVIGVVLDVLNEKGEIVQEDLERAQALVERTGVSYPTLLPDSTYMNGRLIGIEGFPETFFVDKNGNIVGETYSGSGDFDYWLSVVETELAKVKGSD